jgi:hypothetical protein
MIRSLAAALPALLVLAACGGDASTRGTDWDVSVATLPNGASHVVNTPPADASAGWQLVEELRLGTVDGAGPESFGQVKGLVVLDDGRIVVLDAQAAELRVFDDDGTHRATFGRQGAGPGEFQGAYGLMRGPDGMLWVPDHSLNRLSVFDPDGGYVTSHTMNVFSYGFVWDGTITDDGRVLLPSITLAAPRQNILRVYGTPARPDDSGGVRAASGAERDAPAEMVLLDSLPLPTPPPTTNASDAPGSFVWERPDGRGGGVIGVPFYPRVQRVVDPRLAVWTTSAGDPSYRIARWVPGGDTTLVIETRRPPLEVTAEERRDRIDGVMDILGRYGVTQQQDWSKIPTVKPAVTSMFVSGEGDLWAHAATPDALRTYDVYSPDGRFQRSVAADLDILPYVPPVVRGDTMWALVQDELQVPYIVRARITRSDR